MLAKNTISIVLLIFTFLLSLIFLSCDDAGIVHPPVGTTSLTLNKSIKHLDIANEGHYQLWLFFDSTVVTCGKFNVDALGNTTDLNDAVMPLTFPETWKNQLNSIYKAWVTVEPPGDIDSIPSASVFISGTFEYFNDSVSAILTMEHIDAFGAAGLSMKSAAGYITDVITTDTADCKRGIWFCDSNGVSYFPSGLDLTLNNGWVYQGWIIDKTTNETVSTGRFSDPYTIDQDGAGPCAGPGPGYNAPGQEWVTSTCGNITNLQSGNYKVWVTIEPKFETGSSPGYTDPFYMYLWFNDPIFSNLGCKRRDYFHSIYTHIPDAYPRMYISIARDV